MPDRMNLSLNQRITLETTRTIARIRRHGCKNTYRTRRLDELERQTRRTQFKKQEQGKVAPTSSNDIVK